jgi:DNA-binding NarL/FixJ family response regulator
LHGATLRRSGARREARSALEQAVAAAQLVSVEVWARRAERELAKLGGRARRPTELTETERRIADLVVQGKTNHEVANTLHISAKTVEWNLSKVYKKLRVSSRTELAAKRAKRTA